MNIERTPRGKKQLLLGNCFTAETYNKSRKLFSNLTQEYDYFSEGYEPNSKGEGVLYSWKNVPLAYWDVPTLNNMVFSRELWETVHSMPAVKAAMETKSFWGEECHKDATEVFVPNIALRVNDFHCDSNNLVLGDVDLMDTPNGLIVYSLAKTGRIGESSRGFGELIPRNDSSGLSDVKVDGYLAVCWDFVTFPAVPNCFLSTSENAYVSSKELGNMEQELRRAVSQALDQQPKNKALYNLHSLFNGKSSVGDFNKVRKILSSRKR